MRQWSFLLLDLSTGYVCLSKEVRERPFDFQGGGGGFGQAGIFFLHVFRDRIFFFSTIEGWNFFFPMYDARIK